MDNASLDDNHEENVVYARGYGAAQEGKPSNANPYEEMGFRAMWLSGWTQGREDYREYLKNGDLEI